MTQAFNLSQLANFVNSSGQLDAATGLTNTSNLFVPTGTLMLFQQTAAPTGWTKQTTHNNKALRVVSGTASSGGTSSFTTVFTNQTPTISSSLTAASTTLSTTQIPSHNHGLTGQFRSWDVGGTYTYLDYNQGGTGAYTQDTGGGGSHTHSISGSVTAGAITLDIQYVDLIIASKN